MTIIMQFYFHCNRILIKSILKKLKYLYNQLAIEYDHQKTCFLRAFKYDNFFKRISNYHHDCRGIKKEKRQSNIE